jgi:UDP-N-acetylmuramate dehydrogenase
MAGQKFSIGGFEFLTSLPGTVAGGLKTNAGAGKDMGRNLADIVVEVICLDNHGNEYILKNADFEFGYRRGNLPDNVIVAKIRVKGAPKDPIAIKDEMERIRQKKHATQPIDQKTAGSVFKTTDTAQAWRLVVAAGMQGYRLGGAQVSTMHANFIINTGEATASDIEELGELLRKKVKEHAGIELEWEINRVGVKGR